MTKPQPPRPVVVVAADMRLTGEDVAKLSPGQAAAVFEGVGKLAAILNARAETGERT